MSDGIDHEQWVMTLCYVCLTGRIGGPPDLVTNDNLGSIVSLLIPSKDIL